MFSKTFLSTAVVALGFALQVSAHAAVSPPLGSASGTAVRKDALRPNNNCGGVAVAGAIDTSKAVTAAADGSFTVDAINFNGGGDGSRSFTAAVDASGAGTKFVPATVSKNGQAAPAAVGTEKLTVALPAGTKCTGGATKNKCVVSFKSTAGFGNCVVVQQGAAAAAPAAPAAPAAGAATGAAAGAATGAAAGAAVGAAAGAATAGKTQAAAGAAAGAAQGQQAQGGAKQGAAAQGQQAQGGQRQGGQRKGGRKGQQAAQAARVAKAGGARSAAGQRRMTPELEALE